MRQPGYPLVRQWRGEMLDQPHHQQGADQEPEPPAAFQGLLDQHREQDRRAEQGHDDHAGGHPALAKNGQDGAQQFVGRDAGNHLPAE